VATEPTLDDLAGLFPPAIGELCRQSDALVRRVMPGAAGIVSLGWKNVRYGRGPRPGMKDVIVVVNPLRDHLNLNFGDFETLPDPDGLLEGTGKGIRHVKIRSAADLERPGVLALLEAAARRAGL